MEADFSDSRRDFTCGWKLELFQEIRCCWCYAGEIFIEKLRRDVGLMPIRYISLNILRAFFFRLVAKMLSFVLWISYPEGAVRDKFASRVPSSGSGRREGRERRKERLSMSAKRESSKFTKERMHGMGFL